ncbi:unnamed protein product [Cochlearia groenlandica]
MLRLFFHSKTSSRLEFFSVFKEQVSWTSKNYYLHRYESYAGFHEISFSIVYLRHKPDLYGQTSEHVTFWLKGWSFSEYTMGGGGSFSLNFASPNEGMIMTCERVTLKIYANRDSPSELKKKPRERPLKILKTTGGASTSGTSQAAC